MDRGTGKNVMINQWAQYEQRKCKVAEEESVPSVLSFKIRNVSVS